MVVPKSFLQWLSLVCLIVHSASAVEITWHDNDNGQTVFNQDITLTEKDELTFANADALSKKTKVLFETPFKTHSIPSVLFDKVPELESLDLVDVELNALHGNDYKNAKSLKVLKIEKGSIPTLKAHSFSTAKTLEELRLTENGITTIETDALEGLSELKTLQFHSNKIVNINLMDFAKCPKLEYLLVTNADFKFNTPYDPVEVEKVRAYNSSITKLDLSNNLVDSADLFKRLAIFPNLQTIYLTANHITHFDNLEELKQLLPKLKWIEGDENPYEAKWLEEAKAHFNKNDDVTFRYD